MKVEHLETLKEVINGADIRSYATAIKLRKIEALYPDFIYICSPMNDDIEPRPILGAITTEAGKQFINAMQFNSDVQRYSLDYQITCSHADAFASKQHDGRYVRYEDYMTAVEMLKLLQEFIRTQAGE